MRQSETHTDEALPTNPFIIYPFIFVINTKLLSECVLVYSSFAIAIIPFAKFSDLIFALDYALQFLVTFGLFLAHFRIQERKVNLSIISS
jgi:hypothetical protein